MPLSYNTHYYLTKMFSIIILFAVRKIQHIFRSIHIIDNFFILVILYKNRETYINNNFAIHRHQIQSFILFYDERFIIYVHMR